MSEWAESTTDYLRFVYSMPRTSRDLALFRLNSIPHIYTIAAAYELK